jgi:hypothetical protein
VERRLGGEAVEPAAVERGLWGRGTWPAEKSGSWNALRAGAAARGTPPAVAAGAAAAAGFVIAGWVAGFIAGCSAGCFALAAVCAAGGVAWAARGDSSTSTRRRFRGIAHAAGGWHSGGHGRTYVRTHASGLRNRGSSS